MKKAYIRPAAETLVMASEGMIAASGVEKMSISDDHEVTTTDGAWSQKKIWGDSSFDKGLWEK